jgi:hypothetical protein
MADIAAFDEHVNCCDKPLPLLAKNNKPRE